MGKVTTKGDKVVFEDIDKEIEKAKKEEKPKPKAKDKVKEEISDKDPFKEISEDVGFIFKELTYFNNWIAELETKLNKVARRLGL